MTDKYAVIGNPIVHSKSPSIHAAFAKQTNQNMTYETILAPLGGFADTVNQLVADGYRGVNVTVPFKLDAYELASDLNPLARHAGAVNTLSFTPAAIQGYNTDGVGMVRDIEHNLLTTLNGKRVLLLGAGGAAQGVLLPVLDRSPAQLMVANRSVDKAVAMVAKVTDQYQSIALSAKQYDEVDGQFDVVINATSASLSQASLPISADIFAAGCLAYEMMYGQETPFMAQATVAGANAVDGLGMLVEQAAVAFEVWRGIRPDSKAVLEKMRVL